MRFHLNKYSLILATLLTPAMVKAEDVAANTAGSPQSFNAILIGLVSLIVVLLLAILILGNTLKHLGFVYRDKMRKEKAAGGIAKTILLLVAATFSATVLHAENVTKDTGYVKWPTAFNGMPASDFYALMGIIGLELVVIISMVFMIRSVVRLISAEPEKAGEPSKVAKVNFWDKFNKVVPIEKEHDILLDHNYDGIQELDNSLPQ